MRAVFADPRYRLLFASTVVGMVGDWLFVLVLGVWVKELTGSSGAAGLTLLFGALPLLFAPFGGLLADRFRRRPFLIAANLANAVVLLPLALVHDEGDVWLVYGVAVLLGFGRIVDGPATGGLLKRVVPPERLVEANSARQVATQALRLGGPLAGVGLYAFAGGFTVAVINAASFVSAAALIALLRVDEEAPPKPESHFLDEVTAGFRFIARSPALRRAMAGTGLMTFAGAGLEVLIYAITDTGLGRPPEFVAVIVAVMGVSGIVGGFGAKRVIARLGELGASGAAVGVLAVVLAAFAVPSTPVVLGASLIAGFVIPVIAIAGATLIQRESPHELMGRIGAATDVAAIAPQLISLAGGAYLVTVVSHQVLLAAMAVVMGGAAAYLFLGRRLSPPAGESASPSDRSSSAASPRRSSGR
ncbi:MFS transporter [Phytomonospora endophytica]|uniref:MFS family permease n=1 Tax=Phytomonospora endophytica TaxID=714109 RepID=A0A841FB52_9ACTN|nr:MFS transporter [Phytomonospora endophytica]MBB6032515.1 MFS family permease [Phytomonospora endophytica]GIG66336.1 putative MFS-type transporter YfiS [Phytomonospora endophytica]